MYRRCGSVQPLKEALMRGHDSGLAARLSIGELLG